MPVIVKGSVKSSPEELELKPSTPEGGEGDEQQLQQLQSGACRLSAPRGKPKAPPLILRKIKPHEAGVDTASGPGSGSKIPLLKTKHMDRESFAEDHGRTSNSNLRLHPSARQSLQDVHKLQRVKDSKNAAERVHRSVERVKLSKGIEMKRVVQESNGVTSKRFSSSKLATSSTTKIFNEASQRSRSSERITGKRMTKTEVSCPDVKSFTSIRHSRSNAATGKHTNLSKPTESTITKETIRNQRTNNEKAAIVAASSFKTVEEFLKMPETLLLGEPNSNPKKTLYKSKFWEYIDPSGKPASVSKCKQQKKPYDPDEVKSFMDKQKETRKLQQLKESKEKQLEAEKRQRMLKDLDSKCHRIALKAKHKDEPPDQIVDTNQAKKRKMELESPSLKYLKPLLEHNPSISRRRSDNFRADTTKQAQYLLSEFENIVKRECISFLHRIPIPSEVNLVSPIIEKVDKAVGTSIADSESKSQDTSVGKEESSEVIDDAIKKLPSPVSVERAVTKIQAFFRGYKVRQAIKEAKIHLRKPWNKCDEFQQLQERTRHRRWSFPKPPEKPYDSNSRLFPMSPIPMTGLSSDPLIPCYIPPPPPSVSSKSRSPSRPKVLPVSPFTPVRLRVYDDPYPKQIKRTTESPSPPGTANADARQSLSNATFDDFVIPTPLPSLVDVLREKIRLFSVGSETTLVAPPPLPLLTIERKEPDNIQKNLQPSNQTKTKTAFTHVDSKETSVHQHQHRDDQESGTTPKIKKHKRRSRTRSKPRIPAADSTTTADTDVEYHHGATQSQSMDTVSPSQKHTPNTSRSESSLPSSVVNEPSISSSLGEFLAPALRLRYEAEREHLKIIEKALQVKLHDGRIAGESMQLEKHESPKERGNKSSPESNRVQLAIANCHKESMKAAAEMAKWMADFQKTTQQQDKVQHTPVDLAAMVYAAVEEARIIGEEKRREKQLQQVQSEMEMLKSNSMLQFPDQRSNHNIPSEDMLKVDKSVETSLSLFKSKEVAKNNEEVMVRASVSEQIRRDYQQQFPSASESERESPAPVPLTPSSISAHITKMSSLLADYTNSRMSEEQNDSLQLISPPPSTSSTLKSPSILSEECSNETSKTDEVQLLLEEPSIHDSPVYESDFYQESHVDEEQRKKSSDEDLINDNVEEFESPLKPEIDEEVELGTHMKPRPPYSPSSSFKIPSPSLPAESNDELEPATMEEEDINVTGTVETVHDEVGDIIDPHHEIIQSEDEKDPSFQEELPETITPVIEQDEPSASEQIRRDYQQQFPSASESERESPAPVPLTPSSISAQLTKMSSVLADYTNSRMSEQQNDSLQLISPPPSTSSTLKSPSILSEVCSNEASKTDEVQLLEEPSIHESLINQSDSHQDIHVDEEHQKTSSDEDLINDNVEEFENPLTPEIEEEVELSIPMKPPPPYSPSSSFKIPIPSLPAESNDELETAAMEKEDIHVTGTVETVHVEVGDVIDPHHECSNETSKTDQVELSEEPSIHESLVNVSDFYQESHVDEEQRKKSSDEDLINDNVEEFENPLTPEIEEEVELSIPMKPPPPYSPSSSFKIPIPSLPAESNDELETAAMVEKDINVTDTVDTVHVEVGDIIDPHHEIIQSEDEKDPSFQEELPETITPVIEQDQSIVVAEVEVQSNELFTKVADDDDTKSDNQIKTEVDIPLKPPPPYSPSSSLDSTSLSSRSLIISLQEERIERIVRAEADLVWESWSKNSAGESFPEVDTIISSMSSETKYLQDQIDMGRSGNPDITHSAIQSFDSLLHHLVYETIKEALQVENSFTSYIERVRPGPLALQAQKLKIPKTKESLISCVITRVTNAIPSNFFTEPLAHTSEKYRGKKWCSRPKELVDEILLEELVEEDYQWTEWWPEQVIVEHIESKEIIKGLINSVLKNRKYVYSQ